MTLQQLQMGSNTLSKQQGSVLEQLGLLDMSKAHATGFGGGRLQVDAGCIKGSQEYAGDLPGWIKNVVYPAVMSAAGGNEALAQSLISKLAPNRNAAKLIEMYGNPGFLDQQAKDIGLAGQVKASELGYQNYVTNNSVGVKAAFHAQYETMMQSIGAPMMQAAIPVMRGVTDMFTSIGKWANTNPETIKSLAIGLGALSAVMIGGGMVALLAAMGPTGWLVVGIGALGAAVATIPKGHMGRSGQRIEKVRSSNREFHE